MRSPHEGPEYNRDSWLIAPMEQPPGPIYDFDTMVGYILGDRAAEAGEILAKDIEREMVLAGFKLVTRKTIVAWGRSDSDLPERRARDGFLPHPDIPKMFTKYLRTYHGLARMGQPEHEFGSTLAGFIKAVAIALAAAWALKQLSRSTDIVERPDAKWVVSRIGRVSRRR